MLRTITAKLINPEHKSSHVTTRLQTVYYVYIRYLRYYLQVYDRKHLFIAKRIGRRNKMIESILFIES